MTEARELDGFLHEADVRLITVLGRLGIGKSALTSRVLTLATQAGNGDGSGPDAVVFFGARTTGLDFDRLYADLRRLLDDEAAARLAQTWSRTDVTLREST